MHTNFNGSVYFGRAGPMTGERLCTCVGSTPGSNLHLHNIYKGSDNQFNFPFPCLNGQSRTQLKIPLRAEASYILVSKYKTSEETKSVQ